MKGLKASAVAVSVLALSLAGPAVQANDKVPGSITVAFGAGDNTSAPGNTLNHHVIPQKFKVRITTAKKLDGTVVVVPATVNFVVAGFHWVWTYQNGVTLAEVTAAIPAAGLFVNYEGTMPGVSNVLVKGVFPGTPPAFADTPISPVSGARNRVETVGFTTPGKYLVICNVRGHFLDGMYAWVTVVGDDEEDDDN